MDFDRVRDVARERFESCVEFAKEEPKLAAVVGATALLLLIASVVVLRSLSGDGDGPRPSEARVVAATIEQEALHHDDRFLGVRVRIDGDVASVSGEVDASAVADLKSGVEAVVARELPGARVVYAELEELPGR